MVSTPGQGRVQTLTLNQDIVAAETLDLTIGGQAMTQVTYATSHAFTVGLLVSALNEALADSNQQANVAISDGATSRIVTITSLEQPFSATAQAITGISVGTAAGLTLTAADQQAGAAPHSLSITVDGDTVSTGWSGSNDDTVHLFAEELAGHAKVASAAVTEVLNGDDLTIVLTGANKVADDIDLAAATASGGANARTIAVNNELVPGVAQTAVEWTDARVLTAATDGNLVKIAVAVLPQP